MQGMHWWTSLQPWDRKDFWLQCVIWIAALQHSKGRKRCGEIYGSYFWRFASTTGAAAAARRHLVARARGASVRGAVTSPIGVFANKKNSPSISRNRPFFRWIYWNIWPRRATRRRLWPAWRLPAVPGLFLDVTKAYQVFNLREDPDASGMYRLLLKRPARHKRAWPARLANIMFAL